jgi:uncharacterized phage protein (TIGR01671 family)
MNQLLFRVFDKERNEMSEPCGVFQDMISFGPDWLFENYEIVNNPDRFIIMQFTGLKDKNGKMIFEGDIVKCITPYGDDNKEIIWDMKRAGFFLKSSFVAYDPKNQYSLANKKFEILGNVHLHKHLLEAADGN